MIRKKIILIIVCLLSISMQAQEIFTLEKCKELALQNNNKAIRLEKGEAIGLEKGRTETLERIVIDSRNSGLSLSQIESITKLSGEQIISILKQHK